MGPAFYVSPGAQAILDRKSSRRQTHIYDVRINTRDAARCCTHDDVTMGTAKGQPRGEVPRKSVPDEGGVHHHFVTVNVPARQLGRYESTGSPDEGGVTQQGVKPGNAAKGIEDTGTGRNGGTDWKEHLLAYLHKLDARVTAIEKGHGETVERGGDKTPDTYQPRGEEAEKSPVSNMGNLTFAPEHQRKEEQQQSGYTDAPRAALAQKAHGLGPAPPLSRAESRSMTNPKRGPQSPLEDRHQRGESNPRELVDRFPKGDPFAASGMNTAPDAPAPRNGSGREIARLSETTGKTKYAFSQTGPTTDSKPAPGDMIRALAEKERRMMRQICDETGIAVKARWQS